MAKRVTQFVFFESIAKTFCGGRVENFCKTLVNDVPERDLSAIVEAAGDDAAIV